jgi:hypothetical protein
MLDLYMSAPCGIRFVFLSWILPSNSAVPYKGFRVHLIAGVKNTDSSAIFGVSSVTFLNIWSTMVFRNLFGILFSVYLLFKNCINLSLNYSGAYLYN